MVDVSESVCPENETETGNKSMSRGMAVHCMEEINNDMLIW
jgi:hypothetical protein